MENALTMLNVSTMPPVCSVNYPPGLCQHTPSPSPSGDHILSIALLVTYEESIACISRLLTNRGNNILD
jgi:hypothetical protein